MGSGWAVYYKNCTTGLVPPIVPQRLTLYRYACLSQAAPPQSCQPLSTRLVINTNILIILTIIITLFGNDLSLTYKALCSDVLCHGLKREQGVKPKVATSWKTRRLTGIFCSSSGRRKEETIMITILIIIIVTTKTTQCSPSRCPVTTKCRPSF